MLPLLLLNGLLLLEVVLLLLRFEGLVSLWLLTLFVALLL